MSEPRPLSVHDLALIVGIIVVALLIQVAPWWGIPLHSDVIPIYRLQVSTIPGLADAVPYGLQVGTAYPMGPWEACVEQYRAFTRFNCVDVLLFRATAWVAGDAAEGWRLIYFAMNAVCLALFLVIARAVGASRTLAVAFALCLIAGPLEIWAYYHTSEPKATLFLMIALLAALRADTVRQSAVAAVAMLLACLTKETFAVTWVAVLAALLYRRLSVSDRPTFRATVRALLSGWPLFVPHLLAMLTVGAFVAGLLLLYAPRANYALNTVALYPPLGEFVLQFWTVLQPALVRGLLAPTLAVGVVALVVALSCSPASRHGLVRGYAQPQFWLLVGGLLLAVVLHGLNYYLAKRAIDDARYLAPANYLFCLVCVAALVPLGTALTARARWLVGLAVSLTAAAALLWRLGRQSEVAIIGVFLALLAGMVFLVAVLVRRKPRQLVTAIYAGVAILLLAPILDNALTHAGVARVNAEGIAAFHRHVLQEAPPNGHILLRAAEPYMIEDVWATEAYTLLHGRLDLTYHLEVENLAPLQHDNGLVRFLIDAYNTGRRPLPASDADIVFVRASREGMKRGMLRRLTGDDAFLLLLRSPAEFLRNRYLDGRTPGLEYELSHGRPAA